MRATRIGTAALACVAAASLVSAQTAGPAPGESLSQSYRGSQARNVEYQKIAPFKVFDNLHYAGPGFVSVWLLSTPEGAILIDAADPADATGAADLAAQAHDTEFKTDFSFDLGAFFHRRLGGGLSVYPNFQLCGNDPPQRLLAV